MATQRSLDIAYMKCAFAVSELSYANRKKVGAILVSPDGHIIAEGFNGTPSGFDNVCEQSCTHTWLAVNEIGTMPYYKCAHCAQEMSQMDVTFKGGLPNHSLINVTRREVLHAESNAISKVACSTNSSKDATLYVTLSPCFDCAKLIIQAKIKRVVYSEVYKSDDGTPKLDGIYLLNKANIRHMELKI